MTPTFTPSAEEEALVAHLFSQGGPHKLGVLTGEAALELFSRTNLSPEVLGGIWAIADKDAHGWLSQAQTAVAVRLIGWAQAGVKATPELLEKPGPLAEIPDVSSAQAGPSRISPPPPLAPEEKANLSPPLIPPLLPGDKAKFHHIFVKSGPVDGLVDGDTARELFSKSKLSVEQLSQIWELADTEHRGALDLKSFTISLHLIHGLMNKRFHTVPAFLPNELYEQAAAPVANPSSPVSKSPLLTPPSPSTASPSPQPLSPRTASSSRLSVHTDLSSRSLSPASPRHSLRGPHWDIPPDVKTRADRHFDALDPLKRGYIHDDISGPFLLESKLPPEEVARIRTLADLNGDGKLTRDGLAVALFLIEECLRATTVPASPPPLPKSPDIPHLNGRHPQSQPPSPPEKAANGQFSTSETLQRQPSYWTYPAPPSETNSIRFSSLWTPGNQPSGPTLPAQSNNIRFSSLWTPDNQPNVPPLPYKSPNIRFSSLWSPGNQPDFLGSPSSPTTPMPMPPPTAPPDAVAQLTHQVQEMQRLITQLRRSHTEKTTTIANLAQENVSLRVVVDELQAQAASHDSESQKVVQEVLVKENEVLRASVQELKETVQHLQAVSSEVEMQRLQYDDLLRENERLHGKLEEMRESTTQLPWSGGDSELQTLINEDLARENARLRTEAREMQENVAQLQEATSGYEEQRRRNVELTRESERLQATIRTTQTNFDAQRREVEQLSREVDRLKTQLRRNARAPPPRRDTTDMPPPAYDELGAMA
ncbi:hypothetical protein DFH08DRAFT_829924 [Mycena albidolilacea]|uniref:EH domain-containing protein n=1 Tax=Mycena albidolilacea TaxID=1033008 RepID=A0AAD7ATZ6_9AGAR|nr:hypothetical protein DFH08DRAFT_829924 [Mycena albidolilacea]